MAHKIYEFSRPKYKASDIVEVFEKKSCEIFSRETNWY
jgi:hypothetical protein